MDVGTFDPFPDPHENDDLPLLAFIKRSFGNSSMGGCEIDGVAASCAMAIDVVNMGAGERVSSSFQSVRAKYDSQGKGHLEIFGTNPNTGAMGYFGRTQTSLVTYPNSTAVYDEQNHLISGSDGDPVTTMFDSHRYFVPVDGGFSSASQETGLERWHRVHQGCVDDFLSGLPSNRVPSSSATSDILGVAALEGVDETLLAVTWTNESGFSPSPGSNGNAMDKHGNIIESRIKLGNADVGPVQINYNAYHAFLESRGFNLGAVFGTTTTGYRPFDGDSYTNLRAGASILKDLNSRYDRPGAAGRYRTGEGSFFKSAKGQAQFNTRKSSFNALQQRYDQFFNCTKSRR